MKTIPFDVEKFKAGYRAVICSPDGDYNPDQSLGYLRETLNGRLVALDNFDVPAVFCDNGCIYAANFPYDHTDRVMLLSQDRTFYTYQLGEIVDGSIITLHASRHPMMPGEVEIEVIVRG